MPIRTSASARSSSGQSLVEIVLVLPVLMIVILNAVNFGYFLYVVLNLSAAPRSGVEYSILGSSAPAGTGLPPAAGTGTTTASSLTYLDMLGALNASTGVSVQVCSKALGLSGSGSSQTAKCETCSSSTSCSATPGTGSPAPDADPEAPNFVLNRVDVQYTFRLLIPGTPFGAVLLPTSACSSSGGNVSCTINRHLSMRAID
jgi:Flp pilus assembly protein TadG